MKTFQMFIGQLPILEDIQNPNSSMQGFDLDHIRNPHHETILKNGYRYKHSTPVDHGKDDIRIRHSYEHKNDKDYVVGVYPKSTGSKNSYMWEVHRSGRGISVRGEDDDDLDLHLKANPVRKKKKT